MITIGMELRNGNYLQSLEDPTYAAGKGSNALQTDYLE